ncbi:hypothetical protein K438DRAFT_1978403 [Mycena galopus ATCC 62051]|nr:hypothetical protein K438DRAFT_1978403 [Mycena galopus ATCC 62051]
MSRISPPGESGTAKAGIASWRVVNKQPLQRLHTGDDDAVKSAVASGDRLLPPLPSAAFKSLDKINRSVARSITGAFKTASLAAREKEARYSQPTSASLNTVTVVYHLTLPTSNALRPLLREATAMTPKTRKHVSILHLVEKIPGVRWPQNVPNQGQDIRSRKVPRTMGSAASMDIIFDTTLGMEPIIPVFAAQWRETLPVQRVILAKDDTLEALDLERYDEATWFTDSSLLEDRAGGATVRVSRGAVKESVLVPLGLGQICDGEMEGLVRATSRTLKGDHATILCISDSQAALRGITSTKPRSGQFCAVEYKGGLGFKFPHIGTEGKERADEAAKEATKSDVDPLVHVSLTTVRWRIHLQVLDEWCEHWTTSKCGAALRQIDKSPPSLIPISLYSSTSFSRKTSSAFLGSEQGPPASTPGGVASETQSHYILECPAWELWRQPLHAACQTIGLYGPLYCSSLLSEPKLLKAFGTLERVLRI